MRMLVTGGAGFIGSHLVRRLIQSGRHSVVNLDALKYSGNLDNLTDLNGHPHYHFVQADIGDQKAVQATLRDHRIEGIINCAAETHVDRSILDPGAFARTDVVGTGILLEEARQAGVQRFLQVSTDEVYGSVEQGSSTESDRLEPRSPYSASKAGGDLLVLSYWTTYRFPVVVTRGSNTYGPNQYPEKFIPLFATNAIDGEPLPLYGDGKQCRDWLSVYDHAAGIQHVFEQGEPGTVYNVGGGNERENITVAEQIVTALGTSRSLIRFVQDRPGHDRRYSIDCSRLRALGWSPQVPFEEGLTQTVEWYRTHEQWWRKIKSGEFKEYYRQQYEKRLEKGTSCASS
ncbi:MAG: dTDP-glucose 4,6-dehydratase [Nitrospira sp.]|nr:dTDP-glucose 4,6-dehydratase [Nitrospira sp.]MBS0175380.1 dTDP-glucose 4,6-dehydratase [Nitrospira sp.]MBX3338270.1 dTDP-glucose 4,6-dehydratase [Nitrospira sp.]MCW5779902.1 dTDP-glucose 4,6-dehydratase [Nitrospira sp.]HNL89791.1 dTDP-glucose 4,6-dehydratase [Nitrospira sp.]